jgi:flagellar hook-associated protein 2
VTNGETITISGKARDGSTDISETYTITNKLTDTVNGLLTKIENAYSAQGTTVDAFIQDGMIYVEDTTPGSSAIALTLTYNGSGSLNLGTCNQTTKRDLGLINGTYSGVDVAGTLDGETATGAGQALTGGSSNANTAGLSVKYTGTSDNTDAGTVKLTLGFAALLDGTLYSITDPLEGYEAFKQNSLQDSIDSYDTEIEQMEAFLNRKMESMVNRFVAMELALSKIQSQGNWLSGQLNAAASGWK